MQQCTYPCTAQLTIIPDTNPAPPNLDPVALHDTAAATQAGWLKGQQFKSRQGKIVILTKKGLLKLKFELSLCEGSE